MNELEFLWIVKYVGINYDIYIKLIKIFKNINNIFNESFDKIKFIKKIKSRNISIPSYILQKLILDDLKYKAKIKLVEIKQRNINILTIENKEYKKYLNNKLMIYYYGNIKMLKSNKIAIYNSNNLTDKSSKCLNYFIKCMKEYKYNIVSDILNENTNILCLEYLEFIDREDLIILSTNLKEDKIKNLKVKESYELICNFSSSIFFSPINYDLKAVTLTDVFLENGKDILAVPGDIYDTNTYFTNFLIKCGATVITSKKDCIQELRYIYSQVKNKL